MGEKDGETEGGKEEERARERERGKGYWRRGAKKFRLRVTMKTTVEDSKRGNIIK